AQFDLDGVWESVQTSLNLQDLLQKPLFLSIFGFVAQAKKFEIQRWQKLSSESDQMEYLFDRYWDAVMEQQLVENRELEQGIKSKTYGRKDLPSKKYLRRSLVFVAKTMERDTQTEWLIEKIQPSCLFLKRQKCQLRLVVGLILGLFSALVFALASELGIIHEELIIGLTSVIFVGLLSGLIGILIGDFKSIDLVEALHFPLSRFAIKEMLCSLRNNLFFGLIIGMCIGLISGLFTCLFFWIRFGKIHLDTIWITHLVIVGLIGGLIRGMIRGLKAGIDNRILPNQGIKNSRQNTYYLFTAAFGISRFLKPFLESLLKSVVPTSYISDLAFSFLAVFVGASVLMGGGLALFQHIVLRIVLAWNGYAPYRYDKLLDYCTERLLLQRIGGRYRFMHKLLQEHFAKMSLD
ncbi:MAG: hypothetical protein WCD18_10600, partial [Thermosynechococcaceae cyanobacterium]